jgi:hypothetical protein
MPGPSPYLSTSITLPTSRALLPGRRIAASERGGRKERSVVSCFPVCASARTSTVVGGLRRDVRVACAVPLRSEIDGNHRNSSPVLALRHTLWLVHYPQKSPVCSSSMRFDFVCTSRCTREHWVGESGPWACCSPEDAAVGRAGARPHSSWGRKEEKALPVYFLMNDLDRANDSITR